MNGLGALFIGIVFLVGLLVVVGVVLNVVTGAARAGGEVVSAIGIQNGPVRGVWRGLVLPVASNEVMDLTNVATTPASPGVHIAAFKIPGSRVAVIAQWFQNNWTRVGLTLDDAPQTPLERAYTFRDPRTGGLVQVAFKLERSPYVHTAVVIMDLRGKTSYTSPTSAKLENSIEETARLLRAARDIDLGPREEV